MASGLKWVKTEKAQTIPKLASANGSSSSRGSDRTRRLRSPHSVALSRLSCQASHPSRSSGAANFSQRRANRPHPMPIEHPAIPGIEPVESGGLDDRPDEVNRLLQEDDSGVPGSTGIGLHHWAWSARTHRPGSTSWWIEQNLTEDPQGNLTAQLPDIGEIGEQFVVEPVDGLRPERLLNPAVVIGHVEMIPSNLSVSAIGRTISSAPECGPTGMTAGPGLPGRSPQQLGRHPIEDVGLGHQAFVESEPGHHRRQDEGPTGDDVLVAGHHACTVQAGRGDLRSQGPDQS